MDEKRMNQEKLQKLRREVDETSAQLISLLSQRLKLANDIAQVKQKMGLRIKDAKREREIIDHARAMARKHRMDPNFLESLVRLVLVNTVKAEHEAIGEGGIWVQVQKLFRDYPAQLNVARTLFRYGLRVSNDGEIMCGDIRIPAVQVAKESGVDRRVVDATARRILQDGVLGEIFQNLEPIAFLKGVAHSTGLGVVEIIPEDASKPGTLRDISKVISKFGVSIRQAVADDPYFTSQPKVTVITDKPLRGNVIEALRKIPSVQSIIVY